MTMYEIAFSMISGKQINAEVSADHLQSIKKAMEIAGNSLLVIQSPDGGIYETFVTARHIESVSIKGAKF